MIAIEVRHTIVFDPGQLAHILKELQYMSANTDRLAASEAALATAVDNAVAKLTAPPAEAPPPDETPIVAAADAIDAATAKLTAATA